jgi:hypothetical protein
MSAVSSFSYSLASELRGVPKESASTNARNPVKQLTSSDHLVS